MTLKFNQLFAILGYGLTLTLLYLGFVISQRQYISAESGIGYWLGIVGGCMMLLLLVYPARKRKPKWSYLGSIKFWFRFHMFLGVSGPLLIIWHSSYQLGSLNGRVAFFSMIIVASSGLIGRYLYRSIHHGLYGKKISFNELYDNTIFSQETLESHDKKMALIEQELKEITDHLIHGHSAINRSLSFYRSSKKRLKQLRSSLNQFPQDSDNYKYLFLKIKALLSICQLGINDILFSYWHILHFPLFIILIISSSVHVFVVHFY